MASLFLDVRPLHQFREFRNVWTASAVAAIAMQLSIVAIAYQVYRLTGSSLDVGLVSLAQLVPALLGAVIGGAIADAMDRKRLLLIVGTVMIFNYLALAINAEHAHPSVWPLFVFAGLGSGLQGIFGPTVTAVQISSVGPSFIIAANALRQVAQQVAIVLGPAIGGVLLAAFSARIVYWTDVVTSVVCVGLLFRVSAQPAKAGGTKFGLRSINEGFQFLRGKQPIQGCFVADLNATILGMPTSLFPALALAHFHGGARAVGYLYAAPGLGALVATALSGWTNRVKRLGRAVCIAIVIWGAAITAFGFARWLGLALGLLAIAGAADVLSAVFRSTIIQTEVGDRLRGRISSIQQAVVNAGPRLGNTEAGLVAALSSVQISIISGGIGCLFGIAIVARTMPRFYRYDLRHRDGPVTDEPVSDELSGMSEDEMLSSSPERLE